MPWGAVIGAAVGIGSSLLGQSSSNRAAKAQKKAAEEANKIAEEQAKAAYERAQSEWKIDYWTRLTDWHWQMAATEQARYVDRQREYDYYDYGSKVIRSAITELQINSGALFDQFVRGEQLRGVQEAQAYSSANLEAALVANENTRQYMQDIQLRGLQSKQFVAEIEGQAGQILAQFINQTAEDELRYNLAMAQTMAKAGEAKAALGIRQGGSDTAQRLQRAELAKAGKTYEEIHVRNQQRKAGMGAWNKENMSVGASRLAQLASQMQDQLGRMKYQSAEYKRGFTNREFVLKNLTIPGFQLAENQYTRELESLQLRFTNQTDQANLPYRRTEYFDPLKPILGLKPTYEAPTPVYGGQGSQGLNLGSALISGIQGANSFDPSFFRNLGTGLAGG